ncbi:MAG: amidohydrolase family protein [Clostridia bacterium]|nr:amidohydrolase family protein [Clostridia bacterium]
MIIDAHTHVFPDKIAEKTISKLEEIGSQTARIGGRLSDLTASMDKSGVDISVVLPVITKPEQFFSINGFAEELNKNRRIISFAGIHPLCENINKCLDFIKENGFKGIKLHPDYQQTDITDESYVNILAGCKERGLIAVIHAGFDPASPDHIHCPPDKAADVVKYVTDKEPFIVLAHLGGAKQTDLTERFLVGLQVFFDVSFVLEETDQTRLTDIIRAHGAKKILFGTDSPWRDASTYLKIIKSLPITKTERDAILGDNCAKLLRIKL